MAQWKLFFKTLKDIGQLKVDVDPASVITNDFVKPGNDFDKAKVKADADGYKLSGEMAAVDVEKIRSNFYSNVVN
jgi:NitT/TauT family transport system substrate-binding protein